MKYDDFELPIHHQFDLLDWKMLNKPSITKELKLMKYKTELDDSIFNGWIPFLQK